MIEIKNCTVSNIENALRGMRNPLDSWEKSDSITQRQVSDSWP